MSLKDYTTRPEPEDTPETLRALSRPAWMPSN